MPPPWAGCCFFDQRVASLSLTGRPLTLVAVTHLADAMDHNRSLNAICLDDAKLDDDAVVAITQVRAAYQGQG